MSGATAPRRIDAALVALAGVAAHVRSLGFGFTGLDDRDLVVDDQAWLAQPSTLWRVFGRSYMHVVDAAHPYYRPLVTWTYAVDAQSSGARPSGYHATNVMLHAAACALLWMLLREHRLGRGPTLLAAALFAVHPALASSVAWIPGRNDALLAVVALGAWVALLRGRRALHLALFALALLTKETALVLPLVWLVHGALLRRSAAAARASGLDGLEASPASLLAMFAAASALAGGRVLLGLPGSTTLAQLPLLAVGLGRLAASARPLALASTADLTPWPGVAILALLAAAAAWLRGVRRPVVAAGLATFVLLLLPPLLAPGTLWLDTRLYLPAAGLALVAAEALRALALERRTLLAFGSVTVAALGALTLGFEGAFRDDLSFGRAAVGDSPRSALAHLCLGRAYQQRGDDDRALGEYQGAIDLGPAEVAHNNVAVILMKRSRWPEAERELRAELALSPRFATAYRNLALVLRREDRGAEADLADEQARRLSR